MGQVDHGEPSPFPPIRLVRASSCSVTPVLPEPTEWNGGVWATKRSVSVPFCWELSSLDVPGSWVLITNSHHQRKNVPGGAHGNGGDYSTVAEMIIALPACRSFLSTYFYYLAVRAVGRGSLGSKRELIKGGKIAKIEDISSLSQVHHADADASPRRTDQNHPLPLPRRRPIHAGLLGLFP